MPDFQLLKTEIDTDPLVRGYSGMTDIQVADSMNALDREGPADPAAILEYCMTTETRNCTLYGRVQMVADAVASGAGDYGTLPLGGSGAQVAINQRHVAAAKAFIRLTQDDGGLSVPLTTTELDNLLSNLVTTGGGCEALVPANKTAIVGLSQNVQSRGTEIGYGRVKEGHVAYARSLP